MFLGGPNDGLQCTSACSCCNSSNSYDFMYMLVQPAFEMATWRCTGICCSGLDSGKLCGLCCPANGGGDSLRHASPGCGARCCNQRQRSWLGGWWLGSAQQRPRRSWLWQPARQLSGWRRKQGAGSGLGCGPACQQSPISNAACRPPMGWHCVAMLLSAEQSPWLLHSSPQHDAIDPTSRAACNRPSQSGRSQLETNPSSQSRLQPGLCSFCLPLDQFRDGSSQQPARFPPTLWRTQLSPLPCSMTDCLPPPPPPPPLLSPAKLPPPCAHKLLLCLFKGLMRRASLGLADDMSS